MTLKQKIYRAVWLVWFIGSLISLYGLYAGVDGDLSLLVHPHALLKKWDQKQSAYIKQKAEDQKE
jgi:hypothetical protein